MPESRLRRAAGLLPALGFTVLCTCGFDGGCFGSGSGNAPIHVFTQDTTYSKGALVAAVPRPFQRVFGEWINDDSTLGSPHGNVKLFGFAAMDGRVTDISGRVTVDDARFPAYWVFRVDWAPACYVTIPYPHEVLDFTTPTYPVTEAKHDIVFECQKFTDGIPPIRTYPYYDISSPPGSMELAAETNLGGYSPSDISAIVYDRNGTNVTSLQATAITSDQLAAVFPTPQLAPDMYSTALVANTSNGPQYLGSHSFTVGHTLTGFAHPFGVDGANLSSAHTYCSTSDPYGDGTWAGGTYCGSDNSVSTFPVVSLFDAGQVSVNGNNIVVGAHPTTVLTFGSFYQDNYFPTAQGGTNFDDTQVTGTAGAVVLNSASSSVSILNFQTMQVSNTIYFNSQPASIAVSPTENSAYALSSDGSLSKISLDSFSLTGTQQTGAAAGSVTVASDGSVWVAGAGQITHFDSNLSPIASTNAGGNVIGLTTADNGSTIFTSVVGGQGLGVEIRQAGALNQGQSISAIQSTAPYQASSLLSSLPYAEKMGTGLRSGVGYRDFIVATTPTGFSAFSNTGVHLMDGQIPGLTRSIGVASDGSAAYFASPDNNAVVEVPLPPPPTQDTNAATFHP